MRRALVMVLVLLVPAVALAQPAAPGSACSPASGEREGGGLDVDPGRPTVSPDNQALVVTWPSVAVDDAERTVAGYRLFVFDGQSQHVFETSSTECRVSAVNGRSYAVQVAVVWDDGTLGPRSEPAAAQPAFEQDFAVLAAGLAVVWVGVWLYAFLLVRQQRRLMDRYEALFKNGESGGGP
jgi:hypothetical protein